jgi:hypothetical protein
MEKMYIALPRPVAVTRPHLKVRSKFCGHITSKMCVTCKTNTMKKIVINLHFKTECE